MLRRLPARSGACQKIARCSAVATHAEALAGKRRRKAVQGGKHAIRLLHAQRQPLPEQWPSPNQFIADIVDEALYAEQIGLNSAWIGEHHFSTLGVLSCPDITLAYIAARTRRIRLAPAVTVLPLHHPIRVAEQWASLDLLSGGRVEFAAGRGYDRREYAPLNVSFEDNQAIFEEGMEVVQRLWASPTPLTHCGAHYAFESVSITPQPVQHPIPSYVASFSRPSIELAARLGCGLIVAPFAAAISFGGLAEVARLYRESCTRHGTTAGRLMCSYFIHFHDTPEQEAAARARQLRYYQECVIPAFPGDPATAPRAIAISSAWSIGSETSAPRT
jgi:alkanesulfonate monooxygenase SsuD/methylene tetrahydromethanopterin reductase-like flavin-dependent oxidoreductase (luciferase family)